MARRGNGQGKGRSCNVSTYRCGACLETGHNMRTCPAIDYSQVYVNPRHKERIKRKIHNWCRPWDKRPLWRRALDARGQYENAKHCDAASVRRKSNRRNEGDDTRSGKTIRETG